MLKRILESVEEGRSLDVFTSHFEQEAQTRLAGIRVDAMFTDYLVIGREKRSEWGSLNLRVSFGAGDDLVEETDI